MAKAKVGSRFELSTAQRRLVEREIQSGRASNTRDVIAAGLALLQRQRRDESAALRQVRRKIDEAITQADRGLLLDGPSVMRSIRERIRSGAGKSV
ncbi:MAG: hypothetical protein K2Q20_03955 [Phycisphaerales bacterium]|nr:hypothetical protein [Phycisphaerales bacterium]